MSNTKTNTKQKLEKAISPKGVAVFPWLTKADTKWKPEGEFKTGLRLEGDAAEAFKADIESRTEAALEATKTELMEAAKTDPKKKAAIARTIKELQVSFPFKPTYDDEGEETGDLEFTFKTKATIKSKTGGVINKKLPLFDAKKQPLGSVAIFGGSVIKVAFEYMPYYNPATKTVGVSLRMNAVQVLELNSGSAGGNAGAFGFDEEEGYEFDEEQQQEEGQTNGNSETDDSEGDF